MQSLEYCSECGELTGKTGWSEDSIFIGEVGPLCEECQSKLQIAARIGDISYYRLTTEHPMRQFLVWTPYQHTGVRCPISAWRDDHLSIWKETNGFGFCAIAGSKVAAAAIFHRMSLAEYVYYYSSAGDSIIAAIKIQEKE